MPVIFTLAKHAFDFGHVDAWIFLEQLQAAFCNIHATELRAIGKKFLAENSLVEQPFVKNPDLKVGQLVKEGGAEVTAFIRFEVGEGIEVEKVDCADEVAAALK